MVGSALGLAESRHEWVDFGVSKVKTYVDSIETGDESVAFGTGYVFEEHAGDFFTGWEQHGDRDGQGQEPDCWHYQFPRLRQ